MGKISGKKIGIAIVCFLAVSFVIHAIPSDAPPPYRGAQLGLALDNLDEWRKSAEIPLDDNVREALKLDDHIFRQYVNGQDNLTLYIGYYNTIQKVGAAHDPMVCFPGQGWVLSKGLRHQLEIPISDDTKARINFKSMLAERPGHKELIVYWFQSYDKTTVSTFMQKVMLLLGKIRNCGEENAFVRISVSVNAEKDEEKALNAAKRFITHFYPQFFGYITETASRNE